MKTHRYIFALEILLAIAMLSGCGRALRTGERQNRFGFGLLMSARFINLPSTGKEQGMIVFVAEMRYADLQFIKTHDGYTAEVELTFSLQEKAHPEQVRLVDRRRKIDLNDFTQTVDRDQVLRVVEPMTAPVGEYTASVVGIDHYAGSRGVISQTLPVNDFLSRLSLSPPILTADSVTTFQPEKMIPLRQHRFTKDFYALLVIGGLQAGREAALQYELQDREGRRQFNRSLPLLAAEPIAYASLPIPCAKLGIGTTTLKVTAEQNGVKAEVTLPIYANVGFTPKQGQSLETLIEPMRYIMDGKDWQALKAAGPEERMKLFKKFWEARQPLKDAEENPLLAEFFLRVEEANTRFQWGTDEGWRTDRGRIFIIFGEPDTIQRQQSSNNQTMFEIWIYNGLGRRFVFQEYNYGGDYRLVSGG